MSTTPYDKAGVPCGTWFNATTDTPQEQRPDVFEIATGGKEIEQGARAGSTEG